MIRPRALAKRALEYVRRNPDELVRAAVNAGSLRFGIPLAAIRYFAEEALIGKKGPKELIISAAPPGLKIIAVVDAMGTTLKATLTVRVEQVHLSPETMRVALRLRDVKLSLMTDSDSPVATLIKSGALDLSKPGNLVKFIPKRPPIILDAEGDRVVLDLLKSPKIAENPKVKRFLSLLSPVVGVGAIETDDDHLYVQLATTPVGLLESFRAMFQKADGTKAEAKPYEAKPEAKREARQSSGAAGPPEK